MNDYIKTLELVHKKVELFLDLEQTTEAMSVVPVEELITLSEARGKIIEQLKLIDDEIRLICQNDIDIKNALNQNCERDSLSPELMNIYIESLEVKSVANRIIKNENVVSDRIELEKQMLLNKIQAFNQSGTAVTDKYYKTVKGFSTQDSFPRNNIKV